MNQIRGVGKSKCAEGYGLRVVGRQRFSLSFLLGLLTYSYGAVKQSYKFRRRQPQLRISGTFVLVHPQLLAVVWGLGGVVLFPTGV